MFLVKVMGVLILVANKSPSEMCWEKCSLRHFMGTQGQVSYRSLHSPSPVFFVSEVAALETLSDSSANRTWILLGER